MLESIEERRALLRLEIHDEYYNLSSRERAEIGYDEYMERELSKREGDKFWNGLGVLAVIVIVLLFLFAPR